MKHDRLPAFLLDIARGTPLSEDDLARMVSDEVASLSAEARIHIYIHILAVKRVHDRIRQTESNAHTEGNRYTRAT
jgi:hypothetical protein